MPAYARDLRYTGNEETVYVRPGEPTQVSFPENILGGFKRKNSSISLDKKDNYLIVFSQPELPPEGEAIIVHLDDKRSYALRIKPASNLNSRDEAVTILDDRRPESSDEEETITRAPTGFAPASVVSGLMRELVLVAEFGKKRGIPGYQRSNRYAGEVIMHDGAVEVKIDEIFMGSNLWGYVATVTNLLDTTQRLNPASFRLDGTHAVSASRWELAPRPMTAEQEIANAHIAKIYIITRSSRR